VCILPDCGAVSLGARNLISSCYLMNDMYVCQMQDGPGCVVLAWHRRETNKWLKALRISPSLHSGARRWSKQIEIEIESREIAFSVHDAVLRKLMLYKV
jgi:hypothetical protein